MVPWYLCFLKRVLVFLILLFPTIFIYLFIGIVHLRRLSYLSLIFFETLHSVGTSFPFFFAFHFSSCLSYLEGLRQPFCLLVFLFLGDGFDHCLQYSVMNLHPVSGILFVRSNPLNRFVISAVSFKIWFKSYLNDLLIFSSSIWVWVLQQGAHDLSQGQLQVLFLLTILSFSILGCKEIINLISILTIWWCPIVEPFFYCWKKVFSMTSVLSWQNSVSLCPDSFCIPKPNLPVIPGISWLSTFAF